MKTAIITGATGMVGGLVLNECLQNPEIEKVISINRKSLDIKHKKLIEISHSDFLDYSSIEEYFENVDMAYFCIGVYTGSVSREIFRTITVDYLKAFVDMIKSKSPEATFCFLSGAGADSKEKSRMIFARDKGIAENFLIRELKKVHIFRPGYIYPITPRTEPNFTYRMSRKLYPLLKKLMPNGVITSKELAKAIFKTGLNGGSQTIYENKEIKKL